MRMRKRGHVTGLERVQSQGGRDSLAGAADRAGGEKWEKSSTGSQTDESTGKENSKLC